MDERTTVHDWSDGDDDDRFDWVRRDEDVVIRQQNEIAVFINTEGALVIRQRGILEDDQAVIVTGRNLPLLIARLQTALAEVAEFEKWECECPEEAMAERRQRARELRRDDDEGGPDPDAPDDPPAGQNPASNRQLFDDEWRTPIAAAIEGETRTTIPDLARVLGLDPDEIGTIAQRRIVAILIELGWTQHRDRRGRWWERGDSTRAGDITKSAGDSSAVTGNGAVTGMAACANPSPIKRS